MSIPKRFVSMLRSNLNSLLDRTAEWDGDKPRLEELSDAALEAELLRRRERRDAARAAADGTGRAHAPRATANTGDGRSPRDVDAEAWREVEDALRGSRYRTTGRRQSRSYERVHRHRPSNATNARLARFYAQLECPVGADLTTVRKQYRTMMRKYHPDVHGGDAEKQRLATELSQRLTSAYNELRRSLSGP